jgi:hypothetical protein
MAAPASPLSANFFPTPITKQKIAKLNAARFSMSTG